MVGTRAWRPGAGRGLVRRRAPRRKRRASGDADRPALLRNPFAVWTGREEWERCRARGAGRALPALAHLGVDDASALRRPSPFGSGELARVLPKRPRAVVRALLYKTFYLLDRPMGRVLGPAFIEAIVRGRAAQVLFLSHDLLGALARSGEGWALPTEPGGVDQRERAVRFAVNIAMYVLCSDYKDDIVHAPFLMQRRGRAR